MDSKRAVPEPDAAGKKTAAIMRQNAIPFLLTLADSKVWSVPSHIASEMGTSTRWTQTTVHRLSAADLVETRVTGTRGIRTTREIRLTPKGLRVAKLLRALVEELEESQ